MDVNFLFPEALLQSKEKAKDTNQIPEQKIMKSFADIVSKNVCDIPLSQFPTPCLKGDRLAITILEDEYKLGVEASKHNHHGRVIWSKRAVPLTVTNLKIKLMELWPSIGK